MIYRSFHTLRHTHATNLANSGVPVKQLSDRLYLTYAIGLFDAVSTVMLRYTLTRSLHLEARSSTEANSLDIIWEKELR